MDAELIDFEALASKARDELKDLNVSSEQQLILNQLIDSFIELQKNRREVRWDYEWSGFSLKLASVSADIYNRFQRVATKLRKSPGRVLSYLMELAIDREEFAFSASDLAVFHKHPTIQIQHISDVSISQKDLLEIPEGEKVGLQHIKVVTIESDVDISLFKEKIGHIQHCKLIKLPESYSPLVIMTKTQFCKSYELY